MADDFRLAPLKRILEKVNSLAKQTHALSDDALRAKTAVFRERLQKGESENALLPEAFAVAREAAERVLGMYPYDVQVLGAVALHRGKIAEMKTGEGKTLTAVLPLYLSALSGKSCILVTMNDYLAVRDGNNLAPLYAFLGLRAAVGVPENPAQRFSAAQKRKIYAADVVYTTNGALGFDYLLENLAPSVEETYLRPFHYCIIDEADAVLLDSAHMPLVISGAPRVQSNLYRQADDFVSTLKRERDYTVDDDSAFLTEKGVAYAEAYFSADNLFNASEADRMRHIMLALKAHATMERDRDYIRDEDGIRLLDRSGGGRILENTKLRGGVHQAIEAKEHVKITQETRAMASITFQDFFRLFPRVAGMTGSAEHNRREFREIYGLDVLRIPTDRPVIRRDFPDVVCSTRRDQITRALAEVQALYENRQPVLMFTDSIATSEQVSAMLLQKGIPHNVLNAHNTAREAMIIAEAGKPGAVTVATGVAGRGTDIRLRGEAKERGGLALIGVGRMENRRMEMQARGRSGRQGDPGFSRFYVSPDDEVVKKNGAGWFERYRDDPERDRSHLSTGRLARLIASAQRTSEEHAQEQRQRTMQFGRSMRRQREVIYRMRRSVLSGDTVSGEHLARIAEQVIDAFLDSSDRLPDRYALSRFILDNISYRIEALPEEDLLSGRDQQKQYLMSLFSDMLDAQFMRCGTVSASETFVRMMTLKAIDEAWIEQVDYLQQLRIAISGRSFAGHDPILEYHREAHRSFRKMQDAVMRAMIRNILLSDITYRQGGSMQVVLP